MSYDIGTFISLSHINKKPVVKQTNFLARTTLFDIPSKVRFFNWLETTALLDLSAA